MRTLLDDETHVDYAQMYVYSQGAPSPDFFGAFAGQANGLCGAAIPGVLVLVTGLHTGNVPVTVELHDQPPPLQQRWEEIVEASFRPTGAASLLGCADERWRPLDLAEVDYRARYCARGMDDARAADTRLLDEPVIDSYLIQLWPAPPRPDEVIKQTGSTAAYWHDSARQLPAAAPEPLPARPPAAAERHPAEPATPQWQGRVSALAELDPPLGEALAAADPGTQRAVARWATHQAFGEAGLVDVEWIAPALAAMDRDQPLPAPFDDKSLAFRLLLTAEGVPDTTAVSLDGRHDNCSQQAAAFPAIFTASEPDPMCAAADALWAAVHTFGGGRFGPLLAQARDRLGIAGEPRT